MHITFAQISTKLLNPGNSTADKYYESIYQARAGDGYWKGDDFWEVPLWIAEISGTVPKSWKRELFIIRERADFERLNTIQTDVILFSVLDINKDFILEFARNYTGPGKIILGGYIDFTEFRGLDKVLIFDSIQALFKYWERKYKYNLDFSLFKDFKTIPRLTLSYGCKFRCKFCTVSDEISQVSRGDIIRQLNAFKPLKFKLIYLNDKTFFQAGNYYWLAWIYNRVKKYNPDFEGFIIQTSVNTILGIKHINGLFDFLHIKCIELGIESFNNSILRRINKPQTEKNIVKCMELLKRKNINIILNFMIGLPGESRKTYQSTLDFIRYYARSIYILNIYNLALYSGTVLSSEIKTSAPEDVNELELFKSFHTEGQKKSTEYFHREIFNLGLNILGDIPPSRFFDKQYYFKRKVLTPLFPGDKASGKAIL